MVHARVDDLQALASGDLVDQGDRADPIERPEFVEIVPRLEEMQRKEAETRGPALHTPN